MTRKNKMLLVREVPESYAGGTWYRHEEFEVRVMAIAEGYAMVRRPRCVPFVTEEKSLHEIPK